jgi:uncharacterized membrane protein
MTPFALPLLTRPGWFFLIWSVIGGMVMALGLDEAWVRGSGAPDVLLNLTCAILRVADALWITLAAALVLRHELHGQGETKAMLTLLAIALPSAAAEWLGTTTGLLFGHYQYTGQFGWRIGGVLPYTIPLAWYAVVVGSCRMLDGFAPRLPPGMRPILAAALATATDFNLEPVAMHVRDYWQWSDGPGGAALARPPAFNFLSWFVLAALLAHAVPVQRAAEIPLGPPRPRPMNPAAILGLMNLLFLLAHLGRWWRA